MGFFASSTRRMLVSFGGLLGDIDGTEDLDGSVEGMLEGW